MRVSRGGDRAAAPCLPALAHADGVPALGDGGKAAEGEKAGGRGEGAGAEKQRQGQRRRGERGPGQPPRAGPPALSLQHHPPPGPDSRPGGAQSHVQALAPHP